MAREVITLPDETLAFGLIGADTCYPLEGAVKAIVNDSGTVGMAAWVRPGNNDEYPYIVQGYYFNGSDVVQFGSDYMTTDEFERFEISPDC